MKNNVNYKTIDIPIFGQSLIIMFGDKDKTIEALINDYKMNKSDAEKFFPEFLYNGLFRYTAKYDAYVLWMPVIPKSVREYGTVVHEVQHFVYTLLDNLGFTHSGDSDELYSYLMAFVFESVDCYASELRENGLDINIDV